MFFQQTTKVENGGFVWNTLQIQPGKLAQNSRLIQCFFQRRITVAKPVLHQMYPQHHHQRIRRTTPFTLWIMRLNQGNQALPWHFLIHLPESQNLLQNFPKDQLNYLLQIIRNLAVDHYRKQALMSKCIIINEEYENLSTNEISPKLYARIGKP